MSERETCFEATRTGIAIILHLAAGSQWDTVSPLIRDAGSAHVARHMVGITRCIVGLIDLRGELPAAWVRITKDTPAADQQLMRAGLELAGHVITEPGSIVTMSPQERVDLLAPLGLITQRLAQQWTGQDDTTGFWREISNAASYEGMLARISRGGRA